MKISWDLDRNTNSGLLVATPILGIQISCLPARGLTNKLRPVLSLSCHQGVNIYSAILMPNLSHSTNFYDQVFNKEIPRTVKVQLLIARVLLKASHGIFTSALIADRPCLLFWFECSNNLAICPLLLFYPEFIVSFANLGQP